MALTFKAPPAKPKPPGFADRIRADRAALGLSENARLDELLGRLDSTPVSGSGFNRLAPGRTQPNPARNMLQREISQLHTEDLRSAGIAGSVGDIRPNAGIGIGMRSPAMQQQLQQRQAAFDSNTPGVNQLLANLKSVAASAPDSLQKHTTSKGQDFYSGGSVGVKAIDAALDRLAKIQGVPISELKGGVINNARTTRNELATKQNFYTGMVAANREAQRGARALNEAILTGRRRRRSGSVSIPRGLISGAQRPSLLV